MTDIATFNPAQARLKASTGSWIRATVSAWLARRQMLPRYGVAFAGLVSTVLSTLAAFYFLLPPLGSMDAGEALGLALFGVFGAATAWIIQSLHNANRRAEVNAALANERFRTMADSAPVLIWMSGLDRSFTFVNKPWLDFTGMPLEDETGEGWTIRVHPDDLGQSLKTYEEAFEARREFHMEYRLRRRDGQYRWLIANGVPRRTESGDFAGYIGSCIDITDRKESEDALRRSNEDLKEFAYAASHDLQQPLRTMSLYSQVLQANYRHRLDERADEFLLGIRNAAQAMSGLVRDLLTFVEAGDDDSALEPVNCGEALQTAVASFRELINQTGAVIASAELPAVCAQRPRVVQLFENLIGNALKYRSAAAPRIHVHAVRDGPHWVFSVRDNGIGIDPKYHARVFGLFKRLHGDEYPGTGIGLAVCTRIVERYGCRIWLKSERGKGSTFYFTLPAVRKMS